MKARKAIATGIIVGLLSVSSNTAGGAKVLPRKPQAAPHAEVTTPELAAADERVRQAKTQLDTARKQLEAARALVKAAEADFRAARADREALALRTRAQSLADASGLKPAGQQAGVALRPAQGVDTKAPAGGNLAPRIQQLDFNAEPAPPDRLPLK